VRNDHGGNLRALSESAGTTADRILDFSANINPLGLSPKVEAAIRKAIPTITHYPDPEAKELALALARYHGLPPDSVLPGNGSTELIYLIARALRPCSAVVLHPAFSEYEAALEAVGCHVERRAVREEDDFLPRASSFSSWIMGHDLVVLANPSNPAGSLIPRGALLALVERCEARGVTVVVDEAFIDFVEERSAKEWVDRFSTLVLLRSMTKFFALPGLRLGYTLASRRLLDRLAPWREPWSVNALAEAAGVAALEDREYQESSRVLIPSWREALATGLQKFGVFRVFPGAANYLLVKLLDSRLTAPALREALLGEGIAIRDCSSFPGLGSGFVRLAVRRPEENRTLLGALETFLGSL
jgi:threonine-phosphate decarboxylase